MQRHAALTIALVISLVLHGLLMKWLGQPASMGAAHNARTSADFHVRPLRSTPQTGASTALAAPAQPTQPTQPMAETAKPAGITPYWPATTLTQKPHFQYYWRPPQAELVADANPAPVVVDLLISERGDVDGVSLHDNNLSVGAQQFITENLQTMHFSPGQIGTRPVKSSLSLEVDLRDFSSPGLPSNTP